MTYLETHYPEKLIANVQRYNRLSIYSISASVLVNEALNTSNLTSGLSKI